MANADTPTCDLSAGGDRSPGEMAAFGMTLGLLAGLLEAAVRLIVSWFSGDARLWHDLALVWVAPTLYGSLGGGMAWVAAWIGPRPGVVQRWSRRAAEALPRLAVVVIVLGVAATALGQWHEQRVLAEQPPWADGSAPLVLLIVPGLTPERLEAAARDPGGLPNLNHLTGQGFATCDLGPKGSPAADVAEFLLIEPPENAAAGVLARLQNRGYAIGLLLASDGGDWSAWPARGAHYDAGQAQPPQAIAQTLLGKLALGGAAWFVDVPLGRQAGDLHHALMDWIDDLGERPFLAVVVYENLEPSRSSRDPEAVLREFDRHLGTLLDRLRLHELDDRTLVVLAGAEASRVPVALHVPQGAVAGLPAARAESWAAVSQAIGAAMDRPTEARP